MRSSEKPSDLIRSIHSGQRVFIHGGAATPNCLIQALIEQADRLRDVELIHLHTMCDAAYADSKYAKSFRVANLFVGSSMRPKMDLDRVDYIPIFLSENFSF
jgi:acyl-CoA hydrolase